MNRSEASVVVLPFFLISFYFYDRRERSLPYVAMHYGSEKQENGTSNLTLPHELGSERVSERMSAAERASAASSAEKANE